MDCEAFKLYKTTDEYKALSPKSKRRLRDKYRYEEQKKDVESHEACKKERSEREKLLRAEKTEYIETLKHQLRTKSFLLENPKHELGKRLFHYVLTGEIDLEIHGKMSKNDLEYLKTFVLPDIPESKRKEEKKKYYEIHHEERLAYDKSYRAKKKENEEEKLINWKFRLNDPNAVISSSEIQIKPLCYLDKFCQKEISKYEKFHSLSETEKEKYLEKCEKEHSSYLREVESLSLSEKKQFLKDKKIL